MPFNIRVYYADTDAGGIVYHSRYLDFCEKARAEYLREKGISQSSILEEYGIAFAVKDIQVIYKRPAKLDDLLTIKTKVIENTGVIIKMKQEIYKDETLISDIFVSLVCINKNLKPVKIPKYFIM
ncbi:MAG: YbgC/FadM family acyl-CoA thioesterase [Rickettsiales bacterium]|jgi:acyl-CoA thioester hydrolase|nr:YbgC/FadM family acyl-CoA thioesterase [Rickettsiales bacterium]